MAKSARPTVSQERFAREFFKSGNATHAYGIAYPKSKPSARASLASVALRVPKVSTFLEQLRTRAAERHDLSADKVLQEYACLGFSDMGRFLTIEGGTAELDFAKIKAGDTRCISAFAQERIGEMGHIVKTTIKLHPKTPALDSIAKCLGMLTDRLKVDLSDLRDMSDEQLADVAKAMGLAG